ncbi:MAG TPA: acyltransferase [Chitinophagales bacterium]|nr:acyltransferase [Chitinophagales bacterium]
MKKIFLILYYSIFSNFPNSWWPMGKLFNKLRIAIAKRVLPIGNDVLIEKNVYFGSGNNVSIGNNCQINEAVRLDNVTIGNNVMIARETIILGKMHESKDLDIPMNMQGVKDVQKTIIEDNVWLGLRVIVMPGVIIKRGTIVAAGAVITKDTEPNSIYGGVPAKKIKDR